MATRGKPKSTEQAAANKADKAAAPPATESAVADVRAPETRPLPAVDLEDAHAADVANAADETATAPQASVTADASAEDETYTNPTPMYAVDDTADEEDDGDATMIRPAAPTGASPSRPKWNTLASAISRPVTPPERLSSSTPGGDTPPPQHSASPTPQSAPEPAYPPVAEGITDEIDEWSVADQPTVQMTPQMLRPARPSYLDTGEQNTPSWPPQAAARNAAPAPTPQPPVQQSPALPRPQAPQAPQAPQPPQRQAPTPSGRTPLPSSPLAGEPRLASPQGRPMPPTPPAGVPKSALPNPRMERFQELRRQRAAHDAGERDPEETPTVADTVRQWWTDLRPGMQSALRYQHEARASGTHPIPAYEPTPMSRLGDVFGRLAASARGLTGRAQNAAAPTFKRLHDQVEHAAQGIVDRFEGNPVRQQAPFLGPGRVAIFFRQGVTVGQAQRLLAASNAQPMRLIPRKHGFLARVRPGHEADVCERLRQHPYVRDVVYLEYNEYGEPIEP